MGRRPNILLVVLDAARRDTFSPYGAAPAATPTIASLARRGVAVENAYATAPWTLPSHTAMFSGKLAAEVGLDQAPDGDPHSVRRRLEQLEDRLLATTLGEGGYRTHGFSANLWVSPHSGFDRGFGSFLYTSGQRGERAGGLVSESRLGSRLAWVREGLIARDDDGAAAIGAELRRAILEADSAVPQFWFVNLVEAHSPYLPPRPYGDLPAPERVRAALDCERYLNFGSICLAAAGALVPPAATLARLRHLHGRAVSYTDAWLAGILATLAARGMLEDTLVVVTSDHGESFGEDGLLAHGFSVGQQLIHVPLVAAGPGAELWGDGSGVFSLANLPALLSEAAGIDAHPYRRRATGVAVADYGAICTPDDPRAIAFAERCSLSAEQIQRFSEGERAATDGRLKLVVSDSGTRTLADLENGTQLDPDAAAGAHLRAALARSPHAGPAVAPEIGGEVAAQVEAESDALERQMRLLGYM